MSIDVTWLTEVTTNIWDLGIAPTSTNALSIQVINHSSSMQFAACIGKLTLFIKTQRYADRCCDKLARTGVSVGAIYGGKSQAVGISTLAPFQDSENPALVATDDAAPGVHLDGITLVVNGDIPQDHKD